MPYSDIRPPGTVLHCGMFVIWSPLGVSVDSLPVQLRRSMVDLALRLNVLAVCAAIAFVGAILIMF